MRVTTMTSHFFGDPFTPSLSRRQLVDENRVFWNPEPAAQLQSIPRTWQFASQGTLAEFLAIYAPKKTGGLITVSNAVEVDSIREAFFQASEATRYRAGKNTIL